MATVVNNVLGSEHLGKLYSLMFECLEAFQPEKSEVQDDLKTEKPEETKVIIKDEPQEEKPEETKVIIKVKPQEEKSTEENDSVEKITMQERKQSPIVKIKPVDEKQVKIKVSKKEGTISNEKDDEIINHLTSHLDNLGVKYTAPRKQSTGLVELEVFNVTGQPVTLSIDGKELYDDNLKFFIGHINPGDEYVKPCIMMTDSSIRSIVNGTPIDQKYYIPMDIVNLNKVLDIQTLKENNPGLKAKTLERVAKIIADEDIYNGIIKASAGQPFRFAFSRYTSPEEFSIVSSKRNLASRLDPNSQLKTDKEIWINYKDKEAKLTTKTAK